MEGFIGMGIENMVMGDIIMMEDGNQLQKKIINKFRLSESSKIFDIGCGKCFLLYEIKLLLPKIQIYGLDISKYALKKSKFNKNIKLIHGNIINKQQFPDKYFD